jgi:release factor glutamine methyltransferase
VPAQDLVDRLRAAGCVYAEDEARLLTEATADPGALADLVTRRVDGEPLEHLLGWAEFCGVLVLVDPGVFVPRPRTELLVDVALTALATRPRPVVVDLCCGSGAVGLVLATRLPACELHACDVAPAAVACARRNLEPVGGRVHEGDLDRALPDALRGRVDVLVANVPYVPTAAVADLPPEAREHEPRMALDGGADGLDVVRRVAAAAPGWLAGGGSVLVETSRAQAAAAAAAFTAAGLRASVVDGGDVCVVLAVGRTG